MEHNETRVRDKNVNTEDVKPKNVFGLTFTDEDLKQAKNLKALLAKGRWECGPNIMIAGTDSIRWFSALIPKMHQNVFEVKGIHTDADAP